MLRATLDPMRETMLTAAVCLLTFGSACGSQVEGEERGAAYADLSELADEVTLDTLKCAHNAASRRRISVTEESLAASVTRSTW